MKIIIGIAGLIGSGKDTVADYLYTVHGFKRMSFADSLKEAVSAVFGWDYEMLKGSTKASREWREQVDVWWANRLNMPYLTPRYVLQYWGTEVARRSFHDDIWIASVENKLRTVKDDIVISDCRFPNELKSIKNSGGITIRANRGHNPIWYDAALAYNKGDATALAILQEHKVHASEYSSVGFNYDYLVDNNGTIDQLHRQIDSVINP